MIKSTVHYYKLLLLFFINLLYRLQKFVKFILSGKHEFERILEDTGIDTYEKTIQIERWLFHSNCESIRCFLDENLNETNGTCTVRETIAKLIREKLEKGVSRRNTKEHSKYVSPDTIEICDSQLAKVHKDLSRNLMKHILDDKGFSKHTNVSCPKLTKTSRELLNGVLHRIVGYKIILYMAEQYAATKYDAELEPLTNTLLRLWNNLIQDDHPRSKDPNSNVFPQSLCSMIYDKSDIISSRWSHIGFQGEDPGTDFRGMGVLGLIQLEYLTRRPKKIALDLLRRSLIEETNYPFAIVGINITYNLLNLFRDGSMKHLYYDFYNVDPIIEKFNDLYIELYLRFDCFWRDSKPKNIFEFKCLMDKFINIIRMELCDRKFSLKLLELQMEKPGPTTKLCYYKKRLR